MAPSAGGLAQLYLTHRPALVRFLAARTGDAALAEDLVQELWLKVANAVPPGPIANGRAYLFQMANNLALDRAREARRREARDRNWSDQEYGAAPAGSELADTRSDTETDAIAREEARRLASAIAALPPAAGKAFRLHKIDGLTHAEVARALGISRSGVEKHMAVALAHLRRAMED